MASSNPTRWLSDGSDDRALALKMFWGTVIEAFQEKADVWVPGSVGDNRVIGQKVIQEGKSWQFPIMGPDPEPEYHTPGDELLGKTIVMDEGTITIDDLLVNHIDVPIDQMVLSHFDVMSPFAMKLGRGLAKNLNRKAIRTGVAAARTAALVSQGQTMHNGGNVVSRVGASGITDAYPVTTAGAVALRDDIAYLAQKMDEDEVPEDGRFLYIPSYLRRVASKDPDIWDQRFESSMNDMHTRRLGIIEGFEIRVTNNLPTTNVTTGPTKYQGDFTYNGAAGQPVGLAFCGAQEGEPAIGAVIGIGIGSTVWDDVRRNTTFLKAQTMVGLGTLSVWCAGELRVTDS